MGGIKNDFQIFKSFSELAHAKNLAEGNLYLRSVFYYRSHPESNIRDFNEFTCRNGQGSSSLTNPALIFCCHDQLPASQPFLVKINSPYRLFNTIKRKLSTAIYPKDNAYFGKVIYRQMRGDTPDVSPFPKVTFYCEKDPSTIDSIINCIYFKDTFFSEQNEARMCFLICPERLSTLRDDDIEVKFCRRIHNKNLNRWEEEEINYDNWKNRDNYWFEVHLKVEESNFTLIKTQ